MAHSSLTLAEEKAALEAIKKLKASRATVAAYAGRMGKLNADDGARAALVDRLKAADARLNEVKAAEEAARATLAALRAAEGAKLPDARALIAERDAARARRERLANPHRLTKARARGAWRAHGPAAGSSAASLSTPSAPYPYHSTPPPPGPQVHGPAEAGAV